VSAICDDVTSEIEWLDEMAHDAAWRADEVHTDRVARAEAYALTRSSHAMFAARSREELKSDLSHSDRFNGWMRSFAIGDLHNKLAVLSPCYAVVAAGHKKRLARAVTP
jgi:hypothetical protein